MFDILDQLEPFGVGNPEPLLIARSARLVAAPMRLKETHAKLRLMQSGARPFDALAWRMHERVSSEALVAGDSLDLAFRLSRNDHPDFGGGVQLEIIDWDLQRTRTQASSS